MCSKHPLMVYEELLYINKPLDRWF